MIKLAILGAMEEEIQPLLKYFEYINIIEYANNKYYEVKYKSLDIVIAHSKIGKVFSSLTASTLIQHFNCNTLFFSGVAGAINEKFKIGDLVLAEKLCQHDVDISVFGHPYGYVPGGKIYYETSKELRKIANEVAIKNDIKVSEVIIATGDQFINSNEKKNFIKETFNADILEMEGASVALVCDSLNIPYLIIRSISDGADNFAELDFDKFLQESSKKSADYIFKIVKNIV